MLVTAPKGLKVLRHQQLPHARYIVLDARAGLFYKLAVVVDETRNPGAKRTVGGHYSPPAKPYGVDFYFPLTQGQDKVQKFKTMEEAMTRVEELWKEFIEHATKEVT